MAAMRRSPALAALAAAALLMSACATGPEGASAPPFGSVFGPDLSPALEAQRARLAEALRGTPVVVEATGDQRLRVEVPTRHSFEPGRAAVKPALGAVLDQFAIGFKPFAATTELRIGAPSDDKAADRVVRARGASTRDYLLSRGVPASRIPEVGRSAGAGLEIVVSDRQLNDDE